MRFKGKVCIVTGAASGIGRATAERMAREGGRVALVGLHQENTQAAANAIQEPGYQAIAIQADVGKTADVQRVIDLVLGQWDKIDIVVNNAAEMKFASVVDMRREDWDEVIRTNMGSVFDFCRLAIPRMPKGGAIVNVSSVHAHQNTPNCSSYAASKGGIEAFTRALSREVDAKGIRVNCVAPGAVDTKMLWNNPNVESGKEKITGAVGKPEDLAAAICFLASDEAAFIQGTTLVADGGRLDVL